MEKEPIYPTAKTRKMSFRMTKPDFKKFESEAVSHRPNKSDFLRTIINNNLQNGRNNQNKKEG